MTDNTRTVTSRIVAALLAYDNITQQQLADMMDVNQATISRKMAGQQGWTEKDMLLLADLLADTRVRLMAVLEWALRPLLTAPYVTPAPVAAEQESQTA